MQWKTFLNEFKHNNNNILKALVEIVLDNFSNCNIDFGDKTWYPTAEIDFEETLEAAKQYLGTVYGEYTDWKPTNDDLYQTKKLKVCPGITNTSDIVRWIQALDIWRWLNH